MPCWETVGRKLYMQESNHNVSIPTALIFKHKAQTKQKDTIQTHPVIIFLPSTNDYSNIFSSINERFF